MSRFKSLAAACFFLLLVNCSSNHGGAPLDSIVVEVTGDEFNWYFRYPGLDGRLGTEDDRHSVRDLYLPGNARVTLKLHSKDYLYTLAIPDIGKKEIAVPDLEFDLQFDTGDAGIWQLKGDQNCGFSHDSLMGNVYVRNQYREEFYDW